MYNGDLRNKLLSSDLFSSQTYLNAIRPRVAASDLTRRYLRQQPRDLFPASCERAARESKVRLAAIRDFRVLIWQGLRAACILSRVDRHALNTCESAQ